MEVEMEAEDDTAVAVAAETAAVAADTAAVVADGTADTVAVVDACDGGSAHSETDHLSTCTGPQDPAAQVCEEHQGPAHPALFDGSRPPTAACQSDATVGT